MENIQKENNLTPQDREMMWNILLNKYHQDNVQLTQKRSQLQNQINNIRYSLNNRIEINTTSVEQSALSLGQRRNNLPCSSYNTTEEGVININNYAGINMQPFIFNVGVISQGFSASTTAQEKNGCTCCNKEITPRSQKKEALSFEQISKELNEKNKIASEELKAAKIDILKRSMRRLDVSLNTMLQDTEFRNRVLHNQRTANTPASKKCPHIQTMDSVQAELSCLCKILDDVKDISAVTRHEREEAQSRYELHKAISKQDNATAAQRNKKNEIDDSLNGIARQLSQTLLEMEDCPSCQKIPENIKNTVKCIKNLIDLLDKTSSAFAKRFPDKTSSVFAKPFSNSKPTLLTEEMKKVEVCKCKDASVSADIKIDILSTNKDLERSAIIVSKKSDLQTDHDSAVWSERGSEVKLQVNLEEQVDTDVNITITLSKSGTLRDVKTKTPHGIIGSTLRYSESGNNIDILTEISNCSHINSYSAKSETCVSNRSQATSISATRVFSEDSMFSSKHNPGNNSSPEQNPKNEAPENPEIEDNKSDISLTLEEGPSSKSKKKKCSCHASPETNPAPLGYCSDFFVADTDFVYNAEQDDQVSMPDAASETQEPFDSTPGQETMENSEATLSLPVDDKVVKDASTTTEDRTLSINQKSPSLTAYVESWKQEYGANQLPTLSPSLVKTISQLHEKADRSTEVEYWKDMYGGEKKRGSDFPKKASALSTPEASKENDEKQNDKKENDDASDQNDTIVETAYAQTETPILSSRMDYEENSRKLNEACRVISSTKKFHKLQKAQYYVDVPPVASKRFKSISSQTFEQDYSDFLPKLQVNANTSEDEGTSSGHSSTSPPIKSLKRQIARDYATILNRLSKSLSETPLIPEIYKSAKTSEWVSVDKPKSKARARSAKEYNYRKHDRELSRAETSKKLAAKSASQLFKEELCSVMKSSIKNKSQSLREEIPVSRKSTRSPRSLVGEKLHPSGAASIDSILSTMEEQRIPTRTPLPLNLQYPSNFNDQNQSSTEDQKTFKQLSLEAEYPSNFNHNQNQLAPNQVLCYSCAYSEAAQNTNITEHDIPEKQNEEIQRKYQRSNDGDVPVQDNEENTISQLQDALLALEEKCKEKDCMIAIMFRELKANSHINIKPVDQPEKLTEGTNTESEPTTTTTPTYDAPVHRTCRRKCSKKRKQSNQENECTDAQEPERKVSMHRVCLRCRARSEKRSPSVSKNRNSSRSPAANRKMLEQRTNNILDRKSSTNLEQQLSSSSTQIKPSSASNPCSNVASKSFIPKPVFSQHIPISPWLEITRVQKICPDSVVIRWTAAKKSCIKGFEILVDDIITSRIFNARRTSEILNIPSGRETLKITMYAINATGRCYPPAHYILYSN